MRRVIMVFILSQISLPDYGQIVADHTIVPDFDKIPQTYIDIIKKMWVTIPGESHSMAYRVGLTLLESSYPKYAVSVVESGVPEAYTTANLRVSRATWGDLDNATGWIYDYGEEDLWTSSTAVSRTKAGITYCNTHNLYLAAFGFGQCSDPDITITDYIEATKDYIAYCAAQGYTTKMFFTTGTVDDWEPVVYGYYKSLRNIEIRDSVANDPTRILFDYADILCYNDNGTTNTATYEGNIFPVITDANLGDASIGHIGSVGAIRLAKAMWWMLARMAGWDGGNATGIKELSKKKSSTPFAEITSHEIIVKLDDSSPVATVSLFDFHGRRIVEKKTDNNSCILNISHLSSGLYLVVLSTKYNHKTQKIIIP